MPNPPPEAESAISLRSVTKRFGEVVAVDALDLDIRPGELFFLLGPSGCGKTTLLRMMAGLETPDAGEIRFFGRDMSGRPAHLRGAPMVFQHYALWPHLNVHDNVAFGLVERRTPKADIALCVDGALARVGLSGYGRRRPAQLSGGQQQRVALARALVLSPSLLLLDEPLANLDAKLRNEMREELGRLHRETDIAFVYVTHDQTEALSLADRLAVMDRGRLMALGEPAALYHRPPNLFTSTFLGEANQLPGAVREAHQAAAIVETPLGPWAATGGPLGLKWNDRAVCVFRPEAVEPVSADAAPGGGAPGAAAPVGNRFGARVLRVRMVGATVTADLEASARGGGVLPLRATWLNRPGPRLRTGDSAVFAVDGGAVTALPAEDGTP